ncbi:dihydroneopterin aldolase [Pelotomaculum terephthalicicum JT]|uniref:dihydroneopterin aldolase n=1 Tax=Pelotomaculum TaxID=191373 RepID=UPI0009D62F62|nr:MULTISPECIES: dihydroneopterin aldolase [Pelotomaculum]MCG9968292.1 dihydroneopterin aldolase [Pelotomaculum terephthalicicum JT]OPX89503.1 MAG: putative dihydroneopterin aldolase [Pelotomaculum sp. PtaB.Bin117]OPY63260.1 MAG: putative dihydroneopterin aldolase [Pelotomaculum sp. PtaU1.Bin065]
MDKIIMEGMEFYGHHGLSPQEQTLGQRFIVDVELFLNLRQAGCFDEPECTVDYAGVSELVRAIVEGRPRKLIESVAESVASGILEHFPVREVLVRVKKPQAPLPFKFNWMAVEIRRKNE